MIAYVEHLSQRFKGFHPDRVDDRGGYHRHISRIGYSSFYESHHQSQTVRSQTDFKTDLRYAEGLPAAV